MALRTSPLAIREVLKVLAYVAVGNAGVALLLTHLIPTGGSFWVNLVYAQCIGLSISGLCTGVQVWLGATPNRAPAPTWQIASALVVASVIGFLLGGTLATVLLGIPVNFLVQWASMDQLSQLILVSLGTSLAFGIFFWVRRRVDLLRVEASQERARAEAAARQAAEARLAMLRAQIEPHMLFNTLANLRALIGIDPTAAEHMLDRLITFMRATLSSARSERVSLGAEFALIDDYLHLIGIRMGGRLRHSLDLPPELARVSTLPLLLQPLVENAVRHGVEPSEDGGEIVVQARSRGSRLELIVRNSGEPYRERALPDIDGGATRPHDPGAAPLGGFGLSQIRQRLQTAYGEAATLEIRTLDEAGTGGCLIRMELPQDPPLADPLEPRR